MGRQLNILIIHNQYQFAGGEDSVVSNEKKLLEEHGHKVVLYTRNNSELAGYGVLQKLCLPFRTLYSFSSARAVRDIIREQKIDLVHVHNTLPLISFSVYYAARRCGCGLVQTIHNFRLLCPNALFYRDGHVCEDCLRSLSCSVRHACYRGSGMQSALVALNLWLHRRLPTFSLPHAYIVLTEFNRTLLARVLAPDKLYLKPNFTDWPDSLKDAKRRDSYLYLSRLEKSKGIFLLLEAFRRLPDQSLLIAGTGPEEQAVQDYLSRHQMNNVILKGFMPHEEALACLYHAKALLFPTQWYEGFPMVLTESLAAGTPVIGSRLGNTAAILEQGKTGFLFRHDSADSLISAIREFSSLDMPGILELEDNCRKAYAAYYSPDKNYEMLSTLYQNIIRSCETAKHSLR